MILRFLTVLGLLIAAGCSSFVEEPRVALKKTSIIGLDTSGVDVECHLVVTNPNTFDIALLGYTYELRVMTLLLANGGRQESVRFPAGRDVDILLPLRISHGNLIEIIKRRPDPDRVPYSLNARLALTSPVGELSIPVERSDTISIPNRYRPETYINRLFDVLSPAR